MALRWTRWPTIEDFADKYEVRPNIVNMAIDAVLKPFTGFLDGDLSPKFSYLRVRGKNGEMVTIMGIVVMNSIDAERMRKDRYNMHLLGRFVSGKLGEEDFL